MYCICYLQKLVSYKKLKSQIIFPCIRNTGKQLNPAYPSSVFEIYQVHKVLYALLLSYEMQKQQYIVCSLQSNTNFRFHKILQTNKAKRRHINYHSFIAESICHSYLLKKPFGSEFFEICSKFKFIHVLQACTGKFSWDLHKECQKESFIIAFHGSMELFRRVINHSAMKQLRRAQASDCSYSP